MVEKTVDCLTLPTADETPFPDGWVIDEAKGTTTLDKAESARVLALIMWSRRQIVRCKGDGR